MSKLDHGQFRNKFNTFLFFIKAQRATNDIKKIGPKVHEKMPNSFLCLQTFKNGM